MTKTPHDALFKSVFQQPENAAAELQCVLLAKSVERSVARYGAVMFHVVKTSKTGEVIETIFSELTLEAAQAMLREAQAGPPLLPGHRLEIIELDDEGSDLDLDDERK